MKKTSLWSIAAFAGIVILNTGCSSNTGALPGHVMDEAKTAGRDAASFPAADEDFFHDMDGGIKLTPDQVKGRNTWNVWTGGNDVMWDKLNVNSVGALDFLKILSSHPKLKANRANRWEYLGLVNTPCFVQAKEGDPKRFGLWLDARSGDCPPDPFENEQKYPGVKIGARGKTVPVGSYYGWETGIVGLRLFPNPAFDDEAARKWDADKYYTDPSYYNSRTLVKPYRVGMSCGFCHIGPNPLKPPPDPNNPKWEHLSSNVGSQYFWTDRIFVWDADPTSFPFQVFHTYRPGTLDTSLISTDNINNPRTMNAVYLLGPRLELALRWGKESLGGGELNNKQLNDYISSGPLTRYFVKPDTVYTPRVLKDGSDSVGALGALNRVYLNIGTFSEEWLLHFNALVGGKPVSAMTIDVTRRNSVYFQATEAQTPATALFFLESTNPHHLADAPGGGQFLTKDKVLLNRGKVVFAETCARCHSSKLPPMAPGLDPGNGCAGKDYLTCWDKYWEWTKTDDFKSKMRKIVTANDFLKDNFLSAEFRVPVTLLHTNACSPLATNALDKNIWNDFSSQSYKALPSVGEITWYHPVTGEARRYKMPAGGRGYTRPPSLISLWSTAPFLLNNSVGRFESSPSVEARLRSFNDSIEKMLWPEKRDRDSVLGNKVPGMMDRTTQTSYLRVSSGYVPEGLQALRGFGERFLPWIVSESGIEIGPIPKGTPIGLLASMNLLAEEGTSQQRLEYKGKVLDVVRKMIAAFRELGPNATDERAKQVLSSLVDPLLGVSKCPDYVVNRGHYFGTGYTEPGDPHPASEPALSDTDKRALIEFLKTF
ncbi:MAG: hypothetical protein IT161_20655 [Bryobacterales bacterium]|nr:hypothetical protein [Bryobacterales bacterium]